LTSAKWIKKLRRNFSIHKHALAAASAKGCRCRMEEVSWGVRPKPLLLNDKKFSLRSALGKLKVSAQTDVAPTL
jgi:hypothetical protein